MALAYLCAKARRYRLGIKVADNPVGSFRPFIIDHRMREGSGEEALAVKNVLDEKLNFSAVIFGLNWQDELGSYSHPKDLPNFETVARRLRYRVLAKHTVHVRAASLLLAHHEDDQYETVLMRLLSGHGATGLHGMRAANDIPHSHNIHGAGGSGMVDDQASVNPFINFRPTKKEKSFLKADLKADIDLSVWRKELEGGLHGDDYLHDDWDNHPVRSTGVLAPRVAIDLEDGGVMVYRPLLEFGKDRLIATCEANDMPWFEDASNQDPTLTMRNAVRHMYKNYNLPLALQKPSILQLARRCRGKVELRAAEVDRLMGRTIVRDFESVAGTVVVRLPIFRMPRLSRRRAGQNHKARRERRLEDYRLIAAHLMRRLIAIVTPEAQITAAKDLQHHIPRLFPTLNDEPAKYPLHPKAFNVCGVHLLPVRTSPKGPLNWYLAREPYTAWPKAPRIVFGCLSPRDRWRRRPERWRWSVWRAWRLWDNRFWIRIRSRLPVNLRVTNFGVEHAHAFRKSITNERERGMLAALLKHHAPGKVRFTLPAIYTCGDHEQAIRDHPLRLGGAEEIEDDEAVERWHKLDVLKKKALCQESTRRPASTPTDFKLVALPSLGIQKPGMEHWLEYEIRYRRVDPRTMQNSLSNEAQLAWYNYKRSRGRKVSRQVKKKHAGRKAASSTVDI